MATVYPLRALRPQAEQAAAVASVPYDVVDSKEARALAEKNPHSFLHVTKPEIDLPDDTDPYSNAVYEQGGRALERMLKEGTLLQEDTPCFYAYELTMGAHRQTGVVLCASVAEYDRNIVRKHEHTRPDKENDRVRHIEATAAQTGTVFLVHKHSDGIAQALAAATARAPLYDFVAAEGIGHRLWAIADGEQQAAIREGFSLLGPIYIADGHHRSAAASRVAAQRRRAGEAADAESQRFLAVSFPASEVQILPYNRVVRDLAGRTEAEFLQAVGERFSVQEGKPEPSRRGTYGMYLGSRWYTLTASLQGQQQADPVARLDVSILQDQLLAPILGITDPRRDKRIDFVGGIRGDAELERRVQAGWAVAFSLHPTAIDDLFAIADAEAVMPPKSTWFEPKLRDGLIVHRI